MYLCEYQFSLSDLTFESCDSPQKYRLRNDSLGYYLQSPAGFSVSPNGNQFSFGAMNYHVNSDAPISAAMQQNSNTNYINIWSENGELYKLYDRQGNVDVFSAELDFLREYSGPYGGILRFSDGVYGVRKTPSNLLIDKLSFD